MISRTKGGPNRMGAKTLPRVSCWLWAWPGRVVAGTVEAEQAAQDTLTRRQKDSIISTLPVPGAGAVGKALDAADAARARAEQHDTIG